MLRKSKRDLTSVARGSLVGTQERSPNVSLDNSNSPPVGQGQRLVEHTICQSCGKFIKEENPTYCPRCGVNLTSTVFEDRRHDSLGSRYNMYNSEGRTKRILNCGCGSQSYGTDFIDLYPSRPEVVRWNADVEPIPFPDETFDEVYSRCLLEHLRNPGIVVCEMVRVLKFGGVLKLITDNGKYWRWVIGLSLAHEGYHGRGEHDRHYSVFYPNHIKNLLEESGLKIASLGWSNATYSRQKVLDRMTRRIGLQSISWPNIEATAVRSEQRLKEPEIQGGSRS